MKLCLNPNKEQQREFLNFAGANRFAYNESLTYWQGYYQSNGKSPTLQQLIEHLQDLKYNYLEYEWLNDIPEAITKQACKDLVVAYKRFFKGLVRKPKFKKKGKCEVSFFQRTDKFHAVDDTHVKITGIKNPVKVRKNYRWWLPHLKNYSVLNPRVKFDGKYWYITFGLYVNHHDMKAQGDLIGVDLGIKELATCSDNINAPNINYTEKVKKIEHRLKLLQRRLSRKYEAGVTIDTQGSKHYHKTKNTIKLEKKIRLVHRELYNIRNNYLHQVTYELVSRAKSIAIEDLNVKGMMKNKHLSKAILQQEWGRFRQYLTYKCEFYGVDLTVADRFYPSSKRCSQCGNIKQDLKLKDRTYKCAKCGYIENRDLNAAKNLALLLV